MTDTPKQTAAVTAAKIGGIATFVPLVLGALPEPYGTIVSCLIITCGAIQVAVPAPPVGSKWVVPYKILSVIGLNVGWAVNHVVGRVNASQGSVIDVPKSKPTSPT